MTSSRSGLLIAATLLAACTAARPVPTTTAPKGLEPDAERHTSPFTLEIAADDPLGHWRLNAGQPGALEDDPDGAMAFSHQGTGTLLESAGFGGRAWALEAWLNQTRGTLFSYRTAAGTLSVEVGESVVVELLGERAETGVVIEAGWHHLGLSWDGVSGTLSVTVDGLVRWSGTIAKGAALASLGEGRLGVGLTGEVDELVLYDHAVDPSRMLSHTLVGRGHKQGRGDWSALPLRFQPRIGHAENVSTLRFSPDGRLLATCSGDGTIKLWDVDTGRLLRSFNQGAGVDVLAFSPDGLRLASGGEKARLLLWDLTRGARLAELRGHTDNLTGLQFSLDGRRLLSRAYRRDRFVRLWDVQSGRQVRAFDKNQSRAIEEAMPPPSWPDLNQENCGAPRDVVVQPGFRCRAISRDGAMAAGVNHYKELLVWETATGDVVHRASCEVSLLRARFSPDGQYIAAMDGARRVLMWRTDTGQLAQRFEGQVGAVRATAFVPGRPQALATSEDGARLWDLALGKPLRRFGTSSIWGSALDPGQGARLLTAGGGPKGEAVLWDMASGRKLTIFEGSRGVMSCAFADGGRRTLLAGGRFVGLWDASTGVQLFPLPRPGAQLQAHDGRTCQGVVVAKTVFEDALAVDPSGRLGLSGQQGERMISDNDSIARSVKDKVSLWDLETGQRLRLLGPHHGGATAAAFSPDGLRVATGNGLRTIDIWDVETGKALGKLKGHTDAVEALVWSADGSRLWSAGADQTIRAWDMAAGRALESISAHKGSVRAIALDASEGLILSGGEDGTARLRHIETGEVLTLVAAGDAWLIHDEAGHFSASRGAAELMTAVRGTRAFSIDQLSLKLNRPDILLEKLSAMVPGAQTPEVAVHRAHFASLWRRRLAEAGLTPEAVEGSRATPRPRARILSSVQEGDSAQVVLSFRDRVGLASYQLHVEGVPLFDRPRPLSGRRAQVEITIPLGAGRNTLEATALNTRGIESLRASTSIAHRKEVQAPDLYFVGFGVSQYKDAAINDLSFAHRDALDLEALYKGFKPSGHYGDVHTRVFTDSAVTRPAFESARAFLEGAGVDDVVVVFIAGHGMYDDADPPIYRYLIHSTKLDAIAETAPSFEDVEALLVGLRARQKLFLLDTCASGEWTEGTGPSLSGVGTARTAVVLGEARGFKRGPRPWLFDQDRFIHNDLSRRTGAIVFSSSRGRELSRESAEWQNGAFTEAIVRALDKGEADADGDGRVTTWELRGFVEALVPSLTDDAQHPTVDRDNIHQNFFFPVVGARR